MTSSQKRGFRLPWAAEHGPDEATPLDHESDDQTTGAVRDDDAQPMTTDAAPAAADVPDHHPEAAMIDAEAQQTEPTAAASPGDEAPSTWPTTDRRGVDRPFGGGRPALPLQGEPRLPRRDNPLVAGLVKAMREAAITSRSETTSRLEAEATARVEAIRARATTEAAELRKRADEDVNGIREWSKAEIARVRQETDERIEARRAELAAETARHGSSVDQLVDEVKTTVSAFEADMDRFFEALLAESDPARLAALAEQAPDPPDLTGDGPSPIWEDQAEADDDTGMETAQRLHADDAAEAEAEATEGLDQGAAEAWPTAVLNAARRSDVAPAADANGPDSTRLLVTGLTSVAGISAFKGALGQLAGVRAVSVSSGDPGVFVFAVSHDPGVDLDSGVASLSGFTAQVTDATDDGFTVAAHEPAA